MGDNTQGSYLALPPPPPPPPLHSHSHERGEEVHAPLFGLPNAMEQNPLELFGPVTAPLTVSLESQQQQQQQQQQTKEATGSATPNVYLKEPTENKEFSLEELSQVAEKEWNLNWDNELFNYLKRFSSELCSQTKHLEDHLDDLIDESSTTEVKLSNAFNQFLMLSNTQFIENRVYDEVLQEDEKAGEPRDLEKPSATASTTEGGKTSANTGKSIVSKFRDALEMGMQAMKLFAIIDDVNGLREEPEKELGFGETLDIYNERPLPFIIGSREFLEDDTLGLGAPPEESEDASEGRDDSYDGSTSQGSEEDDDDTSSSRSSSFSESSSRSSASSGSSSLSGSSSEDNSKAAPSSSSVHRRRSQRKGKDVDESESGSESSSFSDRSSNEAFESEEESRALRSAASTAPPLPLSRKYTTSQESMEDRSDDGIEKDENSSQRKAKSRGAATTDFSVMKPPLPPPSSSSSSDDESHASKDQGRSLFGDEFQKDEKVLTRKQSARNAAPASTKWDDEDDEDEDDNDSDLFAYKPSSAATQLKKQTSYAGLFGEEIENDSIVQEGDRSNLFSAVDMGGGLFASSTDARGTLERDDKQAASNVLFSDSDDEVDGSRDQGHLFGSSTQGTPNADEKRKALALPLPSLSQRKSATQRPSSLFNVNDSDGSDDAQDDLLFGRIQNEKDLFAVKDDATVKTSRKSKGEGKAQTQTQTQVDKTSTGPTFFDNNMLNRARSFNNTFTEKKGVFGESDDQSEDGFGSESDADSTVSGLFGRASSSLQVSNTNTLPSSLPTATTSMKMLNQENASTTALLNQVPASSASSTNQAPIPSRNLPVNRGLGGVNSQSLFSDTEEDYNSDDSDDGDEKESDVQKHRKEAKASTQSSQSSSRSSRSAAFDPKVVVEKGLFGDADGGENNNGVARKHAAQLGLFGDSMSSQRLLLEKNELPSSSPLTQPPRNINLVKDASMASVLSDSASTSPLSKHLPSTLYPQVSSRSSMVTTTLDRMDSGLFGSPKASKPTTSLKLGDSPTVSTSSTGQGQGQEAKKFTDEAPSSPMASLFGQPFSTSNKLSKTSSMNLKPQSSTKSVLQRDTLGPSEEVGASNATVALKSALSSSSTSTSMGLFDSPTMSGNISQEAKQTELASEQSNLMMTSKARGNLFGSDSDSDSDDSDTDSTVSGLFGSSSARVRKQDWKTKDDDVLRYVDDSSTTKKPVPAVAKAAVPAAAPTTAAAAPTATALSSTLTNVGEERSLFGGIPMPLLSRPMSDSNSDEDWDDDDDEGENHAGAKGLFG